MDTDKKQPILTNTFSGGMDTDTSDALILSSKYRMARNVRYITDTDENTGELHLIEGAKKILDVEGLIIASTSIRNIGIYIVQKIGSWSIYTIRKGDTTGTLVYTNDDKKNKLGDRLSLVTRYESEDVVKLYIADGKHQIMLFNVGSTDNFSSNIEYITRDYTLHKPRFDNFVDGKLKAGIVQYSYRLYNKYANSSQVSPETEPIKIQKEQSFELINGLEQDKESKCGVKLTFTFDIDTRATFEKIVVYRIHYYDNTQSPTISVIAEKSITDGTMSFVDDGKEALEQITVEEYNNVAGVSIIPKSIESKNDYLFASDVQYIQFGDNEQYRQEFINWDARAYRFKQLDGEWVTILSDYNSRQETEYKLEEIQNVPHNHDCFQEINRITKSAFEDNNECLYNVNGKLGGSGVNVSWEFVTNGIRVDDVRVLDHKINVSNLALKPSLFRDELYRYGILFYDKKGNRTPVKWIADIRTPHASLNQPYSIKYLPDGAYLEGNALGIRFTVNNLPSFCSKYEIVRCNRTNKDRSIITQGVISKPGICSKITENTTQGPLTPTGLLTVQSVNVNDDYYSFSNYFNRNTLLFVSTETTYTPDSLYGAIKDKQLWLEPVYYVNTTRYNRDPLFNLKTIYQWEMCPSGILLHTMYDDAMWYYDNDANTSRFEYMKTVHQYGKLYDFKNTVSIGDSKHDVNIDIKNISVKINQIKKATDLKWSDLADSKDSDFKFLDYLDSIGDESYVNWVANTFGIRGISANVLNNIRLQSRPNSDKNEKVQESILGAGGRCFLLNITDDSNVENHNYSWIFDSRNLNYLYEDGHVCADVGTYVCNIKQNIIPYGGYSYEDRSLNTYFGFGNSTNLNFIDVYDGDCILNPLEYVSMHKCYTPVSTKAPTTAIIYNIPLESSIDTRYTYGNEFSAVWNDDFKFTNLQMLPSNVNDIYTQQIPLYLYNLAYNSTPKSMPFASITEDYIETKNDVFDYRVCYSNIKSNKEYEDSWLKFDSADYIDVDTRYGKIVNLRTFKNQLVFWQENATGILSVNERMLIQDKSNLPLILGTGGVLERHDYVTTSNGMKDGEFDDEQSDSALYWWDGNKKEICMYSGGQVVPLSKTKSVLNYINEINEEDMSNDIHFAYDHKYNELLCRISADDGVIVYNEQQQLFTSLYDVNPNHSIKFNDGLYLIGPSSMYEWNNRTDLEAKGLADNIALIPYVKYVVNENPSVVKVFDNAEIGGEFNKDSMDFKFNTKGQQATTDGSCITNREYAYKFAIPRADDADYGNRLRGKTMQCELTSSSNSDDFSLQYINTKYRISWN